MVKHKLLTILCAFVSVGFVHAQTIPTATISPDCSKNGITSRFCDMENGHMWIDLDLPSGLKWAICNVGASKPEEYGDYFAWGETSSKTTYSWSTYKYCRGSAKTMTKYCTSSSYGTVDFKTILESADDAAHVKWRGTWRMPTYNEMNELKTQCTWTWTMQNGVRGYKVKSKNGNSIFLPAAGYRYNSDLKSVGSECEYWSSSLSTSYSDAACFLKNVDCYDNKVRCCGLSVRAVCPNTIVTSTNHTLTVYADGCDTSNSFVCSSGQQVNITAEEIDGYQFIEWSDGNTDNPRLVTVTEDVTYMARFLKLSCSSSSNLTSVTFSNISADIPESIKTYSKGIEYNDQYYEADENDCVVLKDIAPNSKCSVNVYVYYNEKYYKQQKIVSTKTPSLSCSVNSQHFAITLSNISASTDESVQTLTKGVKYNGQYYEADENNTITLSNLQLGQSYTIYLYGCYNGTYYEQSKTVSTKTPSLSCSPSATQTTITLSNIYASTDTSVHSLSKGIYYNYKCYEADENNKVVITGIVPNTKCTLQVYGCYNGQYYYGDSKYVTTQAIAPVLTVTESPTCIYAKGSYTHGDATILGTSVACTTTGSSVIGDEGLMTGLKPNTDYSFTYSVNTKEGGTYTATKTVTTPALTLTTLTPKVVSAGNVVVAASTNISDLETNVGFEWRKYNAPPELPSSRAQAILYNGQMEGILHNLNLEYWKVRAYYEAADGTCYYGDWATFDPSQPAYFEPTVHTYALVTDPTANKVQMRGYVMTGTDEVTEQGFEYWFKGAKAPARMLATVATATPDSVYRVQASGQVMTAVLEDLAYSTTYTCRAYAVAGGKTYYGEEVQFLTPEDPRPIYTLYVMAGENGSVNTDVSGQYREGETVTLTATAEQGFRFMQWSDGNTDNPRQLTIMANTELVALFELADGLEGLTIDNAQCTVRKFIRNNQLHILRNGKTYDAQGRKL